MGIPERMLTSRTEPEQKSFFMPTIFKVVLNKVSTDIGSEELPQLEKIPFIHFPGRKMCGRYFGIYLGYDKTVGSEKLYPKECYVINNLYSFESSK